MSTGSLFILVLAVAGALSYPDWLELRVKWGQTPMNGINYINIPTKVANMEPAKWFPALDSGWNLMQYNVKPFCFKNDPGVCPIYDINGYLIGVQIGFDAASADDSHLINKPYVNRITRFGVDIYVFTLFFVTPDPNLIANGRGPWNGIIGNGLWILNWNDGISPSFTQIGMEPGALLAQGFVKNNCITAMGTHYFLNMVKTATCSDLIPIYPVLDADKPTGFGIFNILKSPHTSLWNEAGAAYPILVNDGPDCFLTLPPSRVQYTHFYFTPRPWLQQCLD